MKILDFLLGCAFVLLALFLIWLIGSVMETKEQIAKLEYSHKCFNNRLDGMLKSSCDMNCKLSEVRVKLGLEKENPWHGWYTAGGN